MLMFTPEADVEIIDTQQTVEKVPVSLSYRDTAGGRFLTFVLNFLKP